MGITELRSYEYDGMPEHGHQHPRYNFRANPLDALVARHWTWKDYGPGRTGVSLTKATVDQPVRLFDGDDDRSLPENRCLKGCKQQWHLGYLGHQPQKTDWAVRVPGIFRLRMVALTSAYQWQCQREATVGEPVGWQQERYQLLAQTCNQGIVCAHGG